MYGWPGFPLKLKRIPSKLTRASFLMRKIRSAILPSVSPWVSKPAGFSMRVGAHRGSTFVAPGTGARRLLRTRPGRPSRRYRSRGTSGRPSESSSSRPFLKNERGVGSQRESRREGNKAKQKPHAILPPTRLREDPGASREDASVMSSTQDEGRELSALLAPTIICFCI